MTWTAWACRSSLRLVEMYGILDQVLGHSMAAEDPDPPTKGRSGCFVVGALQRSQPMLVLVPEHVRGLRAHRAGTPSVMLVSWVGLCWCTFRKHTKPI